MSHNYDFFDQNFFSHLWPLSWREFQKQYKSRWATSRQCGPDCYIGQSLRELICFALDLEPSDTAVEEILAKRSVRWTIRRSSPQFWMMAELIQCIPGYRTHFKWVELENVGVLIATACGAFLDGRIGNASLRAVLKLHQPIQPEEWVQLSEKDQTAIRAVTMNRNMLRPIYPWQGPGACADDEWTNCLGVFDTRRFIAFILAAWKENWPVPPEVGMTSKQNPRHFREFSVSNDLKRAVTKVQKFGAPCVFRIWE